MKYVLGDVLVPRSRIEQETERIAREIGDYYVGRQLTCVGVLKGSVIFLSDLVRKIPETVDVELDFLSVSSYGSSTKSSGVVKINKDLDCDISGKNVLIIEDIVDTGLTLAYLVNILRERSPNDIGVCALLDKPCRRKVPVDIRFRGLEIPDEFVVGYGLDFDGGWRNLPEIYSLRHVGRGGCARRQTTERWESIGTNG